MDLTTLRLKMGVELSQLSPQMALGAVVAFLIIRKHQSKEEKKDVWITSGSEGIHLDRSLHYRGNALDFRIRYVPKKQRQACADEIRDALGDNFDVVLPKKSDHLHIEYDPHMPSAEQRVKAITTELAEVRAKLNDYVKHA